MDEDVEKSRVEERIGSMAGVRPRVGVRISEFRLMQVTSTIHNCNYLGKKIVASLKFASTIKSHSEEWPARHLAKPLRITRLHN